MPAYWFKLFNEIVTDPKTGRLTDAEFGVFVKVMALASELGQGGVYPAH